MARVYHALIALLLSLLATATYWARVELWGWFITSSWYSVAQFSMQFTCSLLLLAWVYEMYLID